MTRSPAWLRPSHAGAAVVATIAVLACFRPAAMAPERAEPPIAPAVTSMAAEGMDASGQSWPLMVHVGGEEWHPPVPVHLTASFVRAGLGVDVAVRLVVGFAGGLSALLLYVLGLRLFDSPAPALAGAATFAVSPGYLALAAVGDLAVLLVPVVLVWMLVVRSRVDPPRPTVLVTGGATLAIGVYVHPAGALLASVYLAVGLVTLLRRGVDPRSCVWVAAGSLMTLAPLALWYVRHPMTWPDTLGRWAVHLAHIRDPWQGLVAFTRWDIAGRRAGDYWHYFSPEFLFLSGSVFALAASLLVAAGFVSGWLAPRADPRSLLVPSFLIAPIAAVLLDQPRSIALAVALLPFGALLSALGARWLWKSDSVMLRTSAASLFALVLAQGAWLW